MVVRQSRQSATAIFKGFESDCSVDFVYSSEDDLSDAENDPRPNQGHQNNQHQQPTNMPNGYTRKSKLNDDVIETPISQQNGGGDLHSNPYSNGERSLDDYFDEQEQDEADGPYAQNRGQESGENSKTEKERSLEKRVTDLENEVSRLNEELDNLKDLLASNEIGHKKDPAAERNRSTSKEPKEDPKQEDDEVDDNFGRRKGKQGRERADTTPTWGSNKSTPRGEEDTPEGFKRLTRGRSVDSLNSKSDVQYENDTNRSDSIRNQSGRKYVRAANNSTGLNKSLSQSQTSLGRSQNNLHRAPSNKSVDNLSALGYKKSTENLSGAGTGIRGSLRRKLIGKRDPFAENAAIRYKAVPRVYTRPQKEKFLKRWRGSKGENLARLFLRGRSLTLQGPNEYVRGRSDLSGESPQEDVTIEWVFGYRGKDCRNNLFVVSSGEICYFIASVAVLYNTAELTQRHYTEHSSDIKSIALHPDKITVATGQGTGVRESGSDNILPHVRVWNSINLETLIIIGEDVIVKGVSNLCFSKLDGGNLLCVIDESADHLMTVWNWKNDPVEPLVQERTLPDPILVAEFHPNQDMIITCSKESLLFWTLVDDSQSSPYQNGGYNERDEDNYANDNSHYKITKRSATFDLAEKPKFVTSLAFLADGSLITGDSSGTIILWDQYSCRVMHAVRKLMDGAISAIAFNQTSNSFFVGCVTSPLLVEIDADFNELHRNNGIVDVVGGIRTIAFDLAGSIYIGTTKNCILTSEVERSDFTFATMGHNKELWGLCVDWQNQKFLTCGMDKLLIYWNKKQAEWYKEVDYCCMAASFHPSYPLLAVGTDAGRWFAINLTSKDIVTMHADSKDQFNCIAFSPNGKRLAIGGQDSGIYIYRLDENENGSVRFSKVGKCIGHTSYVTSIDWSSSSQLLRSNSGSHELLYWNVNYCKQYPADDVTSNMDWYTNTCTVDYGTLGIWPEGAQGNEINSADVSPDQNLIAVAEDTHLVKLYNYPCYIPKAQSKSALGHGSHVSRVRFLPDGKNFISTGGNDSTVILWNTAGI